MRNRDEKLLAEAYTLINCNNTLQQMWKNDEQASVNEGLGDTVKTKLVQPLVTWLINKVKETSPELYNKVAAAIQNKDQQALTAIFNDPKVQQEQNAISQQVTTESLTPISEADQKPSLINSVLSWVKAHPKLSAVGALAVLGVLGLAVYGSGGVVPLLMAIGSKSLTGAVTGGVGGAAIAGGKSAISQIANQGKVDIKQTAKDALKGAGYGAAAGAVGGALGAVGQAAAAGAGAVSKDISSYIQKLLQSRQPGDKLLAQAAQANPDNPYFRKFVEFRASGELPDDVINSTTSKNILQKIANGQASKEEVEQLKSYFMDFVGFEKQNRANIASDASFKKLIGDITQ